MAITQITVLTLLSDMGQNTECDKPNELLSPTQVQAARG